MVFSIQLGWFPSGLGVPIGSLSQDVTIWEWLNRLILPAFTLSILGVAQIALYTRDKLIEEMNSDYFLFAKAKRRTRMVTY